MARPVDPAPRLRTLDEREFDSPTGLHLRVQRPAMIDFMKGVFVIVAAVLLFTWLAVFIGVEELPKHIRRFVVGFALFAILIWGYHVMKHH
jgi:ATP/ADP translocase